ncbi:hypothetical protein LUZ60_011470 [Juncus effusus]|nr:hypothetical protein LUZ60_011470 [Juncus effusus]
MGALTDHRKRRLLEQRLLPFPPSPPPSPPSKKSKLFPSPLPIMEEEPVANAVPSPSFSTERRHHPSTSRPPSFSRPIHAPQRILTAFGLGSVKPRSGREAEIKEKETVDCDGFSSFGFGKNDEGRGRKGVKRDASVLDEKDVGFVDLTGELGLGFDKSGGEVDGFDGAEGREVGSEFRVSKVAKKGAESELGFSKGLQSSEKVLGSELGFSKAIEVSAPLKMGMSKEKDMSLDQYKKLVSSVSNLSEVRVLTKKVPLYKELYDQSAKKHESKLRDLEFEVKLAESSLANFKLVREILNSKQKQEDTTELFVPLTDEEEREVNAALNGRNSRQVLVTHEPSNIEISREKLQCLRFGAWLNDEVINLYLELLKERERREPKKFLKCHFFNTFFYKKLIGGNSGYDFRAVKRWTTQKKLGYGLMECDKIFVPIHKEVHWCLAVINVRDKKLQYLDSLGSLDTMALRVLARYITEEVKDKSGKQIDTSSWELEEVPDLPLQENGWDCGMFMLKYIDFLSRDLSLSFLQDHMTYFRKRTAKEILRLRAE